MVTSCLIHSENAIKDPVTFSLIVLTNLHSVVFLFLCEQNLWYPNIVSFPILTFNSIHSSLELILWLNWLRFPLYYGLTTWNLACSMDHCWYFWNAIPCMGSHPLFGLLKCSANLNKWWYVQFLPHGEFQWYTVLLYVLSFLYAI